MNDVTGSYADNEGNHILIYQFGDKMKIKGSTFDVPYTDRIYNEIIKDGYIKQVRKR